MPEEKLFKIICRAGKVVHEYTHTRVGTMQRCGQCSASMVHLKCEDIILVTATQELGSGYSTRMCHSTQSHDHVI